MAAKCDMVTAAQRPEKIFFVGAMVVLKLRMIPRWASPK